MLKSKTLLKNEIKYSEFKSLVSILYQLDILYGHTSLISNSKRPLNFPTTTTKINTNELFIRKILFLHLETK